MNRVRRLLLLLTAALLLPAPQAIAQISWTMTTEYPATSMPGEGLRFFAEALARESAGRIVVTTRFDASAGIKSAEMIAAVRDSQVTAGDAFAGAMGKVDPLFLLSSLPFIAATNDEARRLTQVARPAYAKRLAAEKQRLLYTTPWPPSGIWAKKPIVSSDDLKGLTIRTYDSTGVKVFAAAGAAPVNLSFADAMPKLIDGSVVAVLSSGDGGAGRKLWDYLPYFTEVNYAVPLSLATLNESAYGALPSELRDAVDRAASATEANQWHLLETRLAENYARMAANGVTLVKASAISADLRRLLANSADQAIVEWRGLSGDAGVALLKEIGR
ncbi:MAG: putative TRAP-type C4-dicarboxylate transport system, periplasmic component [Proteobacteria bacterium]|nr:putative TRAP-type C4-dicarboxylate transport system, periplasmic component [Pseudomonadota bacterium]